MNVDTAPRGHHDAHVQTIGRTVCGSMEENLGLAGAWRPTEVEPTLALVHTVGAAPSPPARDGAKKSQLLLPQRSLMEDPAEDAIPVGLRHGTPVRVGVLNVSRQRECSRQSVP